MSSAALLALLARQKAKGNRTKTVKPPAGRSRWKLLPSWRDTTKAPQGLSDEDKLIWSAQFYHEWGQHWVKDAAGAVVAVAVCTDKTYGQPCPICAEVSRGIMNSTDDVTKKRLADMAAAGRVLFNAIQLDGPNPNEVVILECPPSVLNGTKGAGGLVSKIPDWPNIFSLENGADVIIEKVGTGMDTKYDTSIVPAQPGQKIDPSVLTRLHDLDAFVAAENAGSNQRALAGVSAVTGLLPAPSSMGSPSLGALAQGMGAPSAAQVFDDIPDFQTTAQQPTTQAAPAQTIPAAQPIPAVQSAPWVDPHQTQQIDPAVLQQAMALMAAQQAAQQTATASIATTPVQTTPPAQQPAANAAPAGDMSALEAMLAGLN